MLKAFGNGRSRRTPSLGVECLEGRVVLSGSGHHAAVVAAAKAADVAAVAEAAVLPPVMVKSYMLRHGHKLAGLVMNFSKPLDPTTAQNLANYQAAGPNFTINAAVYNPSQNSVTLMLTRPVALPAPGAWFTISATYNPPGSPSESTTITDTSGNAVLTQGTLARFDSRGPLPNPLFNTFVQSQINQDVVALMKENGVAAYNQAHPIHLTGTVQGTYFPQTTTTHFREFGGDFSIPDKETGTSYSGSVSPLGEIAGTGTTSSYTNYVQNFPFEIGSLQTSQGEVDLTFVHLATTGTNSRAGDYMISGGTGAYAGVTGSGQVQLTWDGTTKNGTFTATYS